MFCILKAESIFNWQEFNMNWDRKIGLGIMLEGALLFVWLKILKLAEKNKIKLHTFLLPPCVLLCLLVK